MKKNNIIKYLVFSSDNAVMGIPMTLVIISIISMIIISLFVVSAGFIQSSYEKEQLKTDLTEIINKISTIRSYATYGSQITQPLHVPLSVESLFFGGTLCSINHSTNSSQFCYDEQCSIICILSNGENLVLHSETAFCDEQGKPICLHSGQHTLIFTLEQHNQEVFAVASIQQ
jgi:hypothetical protein